MWKVWSQENQVMFTVEFRTIAHKANSRTAENQRQLEFGMEMPRGGKPRFEDLSNEKAVLLFLRDRFKQRFHSFGGEQNRITSRQQCRRKSSPNQSPSVMRTTPVSSDEIQEED